MSCNCTLDQRHFSRTVLSNHQLKRQSECEEGTKTSNQSQLCTLPELYLSTEIRNTLQDWLWGSKVSDTWGIMMSYSAVRTELECSPVFFLSQPFLLHRQSKIHGHLYWLPQQETLHGVPSVPKLATYEKGWI
uniref:AlNc14C118G6579 protein n=1 Tax=Albugo laibachii Nc14 TaxID=890382 RepID=F0WJ48_9STRA|nr:AlNc14C118G6579 [Albugo laibachii Nc14]|eukprot:CCA21294.1 AlNc14C118G6579 [Albugo laibachii Nc14]